MQHIRHHHGTFGIVDITGTPAFALQHFEQRPIAGGKSYFTILEDDRVGFIFIIGGLDNFLAHLENRIQHRFYVVFRIVVRKLGIVEYIIIGQPFLNDEFEISDIVYCEIRSHLFIPSTFIISVYMLRVSLPIFLKRWVMAVQTITQNIDYREE